MPDLKVSELNSRALTVESSTILEADAASGLRGATTVLLSFTRQAHTLSLARTKQAACHPS